MKRNISVGIALTILILLAVAIGGLIWLDSTRDLAIFSTKIQSSQESGEASIKDSLYADRNNGSLNELVPSPGMVVGSQVVTVYIWHSYKGSPNFSTVILPVWGLYQDKESTEREYTVDIWDGKDFIFYTKTSPLKEITFPSGGVYKFRVQGINSDYAICPSSGSSGYKWGIKFATQGTFKGEMTPITIDVSPQGKSCRALTFLLPASGNFKLKVGESAQGVVDGKQVVLLNTGGGHSTIHVGDSTPVETSTNNTIGETTIVFMDRDKNDESIRFVVIPPNPNPHNEITTPTAGIMQGMETPSTSILTGEVSVPAGFFAPSPTSFPSEYKLFLQSNQKDSYAIQYNVGTDRIFVREFTEDTKDNCDTRIEETEKTGAKKLKEFIFENSAGTIMKELGQYSHTYLYWNDGNRCLSIQQSVTKSDYGFSFDDMVAILKTFIRQ